MFGKTYGIKTGKQMVPVVMMFVVCAGLCFSPARVSAEQTAYADTDWAEPESETEIPTMDAVPKSGALHGLVPTAVREAEKLSGGEEADEIMTETMYPVDPFSKTRDAEAETETKTDVLRETEGVSETEEDTEEDLTEAEDMKWKKEEFEDIGLTVEIPDMCVVEKAEDPGYRYIYLGKSNEIIPYIILGTWENVDMNIFSDVFLDYMKGHFPDIVVSQDETPVIINNHQMYKWVYEYTLTGSRCRDTRIAWPVGNKRIILFGSKEIPDMRYTLGDLLMKVVSGAVYEEDSAEWMKGTVDGNTYRSDTFQMETVLPEGWRFETDEEIAKTASLVRNLAGDEGFPEYAVQDVSQYDASAVNEDGTMRWNIVLQDFTGYALEDVVSEADIEKLTQEIKDRERGFTEDGLLLYSFGFAQDDGVWFCENGYPSVLAQMTCGDTEVFQRTVLLTFGETTAAYLTVTTEGEDRTAEVLEMFHVPPEEEPETKTETETGGEPAEERPVP